MNARLRSAPTVWIAKVFCVALAVYIVGRLGRVSIAPSGEFARIWTGSGVALASLLFFGNGIWPGAWLGSFLIESATTLEGSGTQATVSLLFASVVATGTALQAATGSWIIRRVLDKVPTVDSVNEVLALLGLGGVLCTLLGAAARSVGLFSPDLISRFIRDDLSSHGGISDWRTWEASWGAELTGVFVFAPLALILLNPKTHPFAGPGRLGRLGRRQVLRFLEFVTLFVAIPVVVLQIGNERATDFGVILMTASALWATLRFGRAGTGLNLFVMAMILASNVSTGSQLLGAIRTGPATATTDAQILQGTFSVTFWSLAAILSDRERVATELRESEGRFRQFSEGMPHVIWMMTPDKFHFLYVNRAFEQVYGLSREDLYASSGLWLASIHPEDRQRAAEARWGHAGAGEYCEEYRVIRPDGTVRWVRESAVPLRNERGEIALFGGTVEDITQSRQDAQDLSRQQSELLHVSRLSSVGQMVATLSHEVAQPMSAIGTFATVCASLLKSEPLTANRLENIRQCIESITAENQRCRAILRRLRDYTRKAPRQRTACDLNAVINESLDLILHELQRDNVKVRRKLAPSAVLVSGDRIQLQQVIINLLTNARDALVHVDPARRVVALRSEADGEFVTIEVADQGIGLPAEENDRLFEPFFTTKAEGVGIGLSICKTILEEHGGEISGFTNESGGATFRIRLPVAGKRPQEQELPRQPAQTDGQRSRTAGGMASQGFEAQAPREPSRVNNDSLKTD